MDIQWSTIWQYSNALGKKGRRGAFADPLDGPEWEGLVWAPVLVASISCWIASLSLAFPMRDRARRPVKAVPDHGVCVS